ncbi:uncharacterized protein RAG0_02955 [Rhynchosporium agropyri]|uniref:Uncharacterized protein n=1 Tax=Rhynchosporium agropyri TaxID=914238 RepID=A0A1E1K2T7_9HELO|nr:uncharacterized protein RAG0_02955 [Rhynchosporium agropyri]
MARLSIFIVYSMIGRLTLADVTFSFTNQCKTTIWPALHHGAPTQMKDPLPAGLSLKEGETHVALPLNIDNEPLDGEHQPMFSGRIWARQYCGSLDGTNCKVGNCDNSSCWDSSAANTTLAEFSIKSSQIYYDISLGEFVQSILYAGDRLIGQSNVARWLSVVFPSVKGLALVNLVAKINLICHLHAQPRIHGLKEHAQMPIAMHMMMQQQRNTVPQARKISILHFVLNEPIDSEVILRVCKYRLTKQQPAKHFTYARVNI